jgi:chromosome segregation ATPase
MSDDMKRELNALKTEMHKSIGDLRDELRKGLSESRRETGELRDELRKGLNESRQETGELRTELRHGMSDIRAMFRRTMIHVAKMTGDMADMKRDMATKADISRLTGNIEGLSGKVGDMHLDWAKNHDRLNDHEKRLDRLEPRRA